MRFSLRDILIFTVGVSGFVAVLISTNWLTSLLGWSALGIYMMLFRNWAVLRFHLLGPVIAVGVWLAGAAFGEPIPIESLAKLIHDGCLFSSLASFPLSLLFAWLRN